MAFFLKQAEGFLDAVDKRAKEASSKREWDSRGPAHRRFSEGGVPRPAPEPKPQPSTPLPQADAGNHRRQTGPASYVDSSKLNAPRAPIPATRPGSMHFSAPTKGLEGLTVPAFKPPAAVAGPESYADGISLPQSSSELGLQQQRHESPLPSPPSEQTTLQESGVQQLMPAEAAGAAHQSTSAPAFKAAAASDAAAYLPDGSSVPEQQPITMSQPASEAPEAPALPDAASSSAALAEHAPATAALPPATERWEANSEAFTVSNAMPSSVLEAQAPERTRAVADAIKLATAASKLQQSSDGALSDTGSDVEGVDNDAQTSKRQLRLVMVVDQLKRRLDALRDENIQLEGMLHAADARAADSAAAASHLEDALARAEAQNAASTGAHAAALAARDADLQQQREAAAHAQDLLADVRASYASLQDRHRQLVQGNEAKEGDLVEGLRQQVDSLESRLEHERAVQATTQRTFAAREAELESNLAESAGAMAAMQRALDERALQASLASEQAHTSAAETSALRTQLAQLGQQQQQAQAQSAMQPPAELLEELGALHKANAQLQATCQAAESRSVGQQAECTRLQGQVDSLRAQLHHNRDMPELQRQFKEVTDLLYQKQAQLEEMAANKAVQQMTHERELAAAKSEAERSARGSRRQNSMPANSLLSDGDLLVPMEAMGEPYYRLTRHRRFGHAIKTSARQATERLLCRRRALDSWSAAAVQFLKRYPLGRLGVLAYLLCLHLFVWLLIHRMQRAAFAVEHEHHMSHEILAHQ